MSTTTTTTTTSPRTAPARPLPLADPGRRAAATTAGAGLLVMAAVAAPANAVLQRLTGAADPAELSARLTEVGTLARVALVAFLAVVVLDVVVAWGLARFLQRDTPSLATLAGWLRVGYAAMLGAAVLRLGEGLLAQDGGSAWSGVQGFAEGWRLALLVFGVHLVVVGAALLRTADVPRPLGGAVVLAGLAYSTDTVVPTLLDDPSAPGALLTALVAVLALVGELGMALWLLVRGRRA